MAAISYAAKIRSRQLDAFFEEQEPDE